MITITLLPISDTFNCVSFQSEHPLLSFRVAVPVVLGPFLPILLLQLLELLELVIAQKRFRIRFQLDELLTLMAIHAPVALLHPLQVLLILFGFFVSVFGALVLALVFPVLAVLLTATFEAIVRHVIVGILPSELLFPGVLLALPVAQIHLLEQPQLTLLFVILLLSVLD